jgi:hypothetical protein
MIFQLATFPPSKHLKTFLTDYIDKSSKDDSKTKIQEMAKVCQSRLPTITVMGQRKQVPSALELECLRELKPSEFLSSLSPRLALSLADHFSRLVSLAQSRCASIWSTARSRPSTSTPTRSCRTCRISWYCPPLFDCSSSVVCLSACLLQLCCVLAPCSC